MRSHFAIVHTDAEQPYLVRFFADDGEEVFRSSENYTDLRAAERAVCIMAEAFYVGDASLIAEVVRALDGRKRIQMSRGGRPSVHLSVPIVYADERAPRGEG